VMARFITTAALVFLVAVISAIPAEAGPCPRGMQLEKIYTQLYNLKSAAAHYAVMGQALEVTKTRIKINTLSSQIPFYHLEQEIRNFPIFRNAACLVGAMRGASGHNLGWQPRSDGLLDLHLNGKMFREGISAADLLSIAKSMR
jgi:hypothetical protein